jgi:hypothetical protein
MAAPRQSESADLGESIRHSPTRMDTDPTQKICGGNSLAGRCDLFFGLPLLYQAPWSCGFEPVPTESG